METEHDFSALRNLLALRKLEVPMDTEVNRFLIEFHRRQRAQLLAPPSRWARVRAWAGEKLEGLHIVPSFSYASGFAAVALMLAIGLSGGTELVAHHHSSRLSLSMAGTEASQALMPVTFVHDAAPASPKSDGLAYTPKAANAGATRFILANTRVAYDATAAF